jgi:hypothetical protein
MGKTRGKVLLRPHSSGYIKVDRALEITAAASSSGDDGKIVYARRIITATIEFYRTGSPPIEK